MGILVVEDNIDCAASTAMLLRMYGHEVRVALDGQAAVRAAGDFRPDVVLLDIGLPGMDGYAVATAIKRFERGPNEKRPLIIAISGFAKAADHRSEDCGIDLYLLKPVDPVQLK